MIGKKRPVARYGRHGKEEKDEVDILECERAACMHAEGIYGVFQGS